MTALSSDPPLPEAVMHNDVYPPKSKIYARHGADTSTA